MNYRAYLLTLCLSGLLSACVMKAPAPTTQPTVVQVLATAPTVEPTQAELPTPSAEPPTLTPTSAPTSTLPVNLPTAAATQSIDSADSPRPTGKHFGIRIITPAEVSKVISPFDLSFHVAPGYTGVTRIELIGESGELIFRKVSKTYPNVGYYTKVTESIAFNLPVTAEMAKVQVSTYDSSGRMLALSSSRVLLQALGETVLAPQGDLSERVRFSYPTAGAEVVGGQFIARGEYFPADTLPAYLDLLGPDGKVIETRPVTFGPPVGNLLPFSVDFKAKVSDKTPMLLGFRQADDRFPGLIYYFSIPITLLP